MTPSTGRLIHRIWHFLIAFGMEKNVAFYTPSEWAERKETEIGDVSSAVLHMTAEGAFQEAMRTSFQPIEEAFRHILKSEGVWMEVGFSWSFHFFPIEED